MATTSRKLMATSMIAGAAMAAFGGMGDVQAGENKTVSDVIGMSSVQRSHYIVDKVSERSVEIGASAGGGPLTCLTGIFLKTRVVDGEKDLSAGHSAVLEFLVKANGSGKGAASAEQAIDLVVDHVAKSKCGVSPDQLAAAAAAKPAPAGSG